MYVVGMKTWIHEIMDTWNDENLVSFPSLSPSGNEICLAIQYYMYSTSRIMDTRFAPTTVPDAGQWEDKVKAYHLPRAEINKVIMEYLVKEGFKEVHVTLSLIISVKKCASSAIVLLSILGLVRVAF